MSKITIKEIKERYLEAKEKEKKFKWTYYVRRPASYYLAWPFLRLGISASTVTVFWLSVALVGCAFVASGGYVNMIIGSILLELAVILDCVDGHLARFSRPTYSGDVLDTWAGEILLVLSLLSLGIGLSSNSSEPLTLIMTSNFIQIDNGLFIYLGIFSSLAALSSWTVRLHWRTITLKLSLNYEPGSNSKDSKKIMILDNIFHYSGGLTVLMLVSSILHALDVMLILTAIVYSSWLLIMMSRILRHAHSLDSNYMKDNSR